MARKRRFKFDSIVISRATTAGGSDVFPGEVMPIYGDDAAVTEEEVLLLISRGSALEGSKKNIAKVDERVKAAKTVEAKKVEDKNRSEAKAHELAQQALEAVDGMLVVIKEMQDRIEALEQQLAEVSAPIDEASGE